MQFLGVDTLDAREGAEAFIAEFAVPFPSLFDPDGAIRTDLDSFGLPVTVFFDAEANQVGKVDGELSQSRARRAPRRDPGLTACRLSGSLVGLWQPSVTSVARSRSSARP